MTTIFEIFPKPCVKAQIANPGKYENPDAMLKHKLANILIAGFDALPFVRRGISIKTREIMMVTQWEGVENEENKDELIASLTKRRNRFCKICSHYTKGSCTGFETQQEIVGDKTAIEYIPQIKPDILN